MLLGDNARRIFSENVHCWHRTPITVKKLVAISQGLKNKNWMNTYRNIRPYPGLQKKQVIFWYFIDFRFYEGWFHGILV